MNILKFRTSERVLFNKAIMLRMKIFIGEQKVPQDLEFEYEDESTHFIVLDDMGEALGTGRWRKTEEGVKLERFAVLKEFRKQGIGTKILDAILEDVKDENKIIYLNSQESALGFYEKCGFEVKGDPFEEAGIIHYKMVKHS